MPRALGHPSQGRGPHALGVSRNQVLARVDQTTVLLGVLGVSTAAFFIMHGLCTMSFNQVRWGLPLFITAGVVLRTRMMHLTQMRLNAEQEAYEAYLAEQQAPEEAYAQVVGQGHAVEEPVFGNWYGSN